MKNRFSLLGAAFGVAFLMIGGFLVARLAFAAGNGNRGRELFEKRCTGCHALDTEIGGPRLRGVYGRPAGELASFPYSEALRKSRITWDDGSLDQWLTDPDAFVPDNDMAFRVANPEERTAIIGYLKELSR